MIPFMIVGDGPQEPTGLGRIARDLAGQIVTSDLPVDFVHVGGSIPPIWAQWRHYPLDRSQGDWGASYVEALWRSIFGNDPGILWVIWDPGRLAAFTNIQLPVQKWAYTAIDSANIRDSVGGPARQALAEFDRVLTYGRWADTIVQTVRPQVQYLPHGLSLQTYSPAMRQEEVEWVQQTLGPFFNPEHHVLIGCVATNQPRKDLGLYFHTLSKLRERGINVYGWLHTDVLVKDWAVQQLVEDFGLIKKVAVTLPELSDRQLALLYHACNVTIAPGLGEGFGYPIAESLAAGVPVVHGDYGGGVELIPKVEWRFPVRALRLESVYAIKRPVFAVDDVANAVERALSWRKEVGLIVASAYCRGCVAHLDWPNLWLRWQSWIRQGLQDG